MIKKTRESRNHLSISLLYSIHHKIHFSINLLTYSLLHSQIFFKFQQLYTPVQANIQISLCQTPNGSQTLLYLFPSPKCGIKETINKQTKRKKKIKTTVNQTLCINLIVTLFYLLCGNIFLLLPFFLPHNSFLNKPPLHHFLLGTIAREPTAVSSA